MHARRVLGFLTERGGGDSFVILKVPASVAWAHRGESFIAGEVDVQLKCAF